MINDVQGMSARGSFKEFVGVGSYSSMYLIDAQSGVDEKSVTGYLGGLSSATRTVGHS